MNRDTLILEIRRVERAYRNADNHKARHDHGKHLRRLYNELRYYDRKMEQWQTSKI